MISTALKYLIIDKCLDVFFHKVCTNLAIVPSKGRYQVGQRVDSIVVHDENQNGFIIYWKCIIVEVNLESNWIVVDYNMAFHTSFFSTHIEALEEYEYRKHTTGDDEEVVHTIDGNCVTTTWKVPDSELIFIDDIVDNNVMRVHIK
jgi:hypothetical protein